MRHAAAISAAQAASIRPLQDSNRRKTAMPDGRNNGALSRPSLDGEAGSTNVDPDRAASPAIVLGGIPHLEVRCVDGLGVVDIVDTDVLFEEGAIRELG